MRFKCLFVAVAFFGCNNQPPNVAPQKSDTIPGQTVENVRLQKPKFDGHTEQTFNIADTTRFLRILLNNDELIKCWMVYYDRDQTKWNVLYWIGRGSNNHILVDTIFNQQVGVENSYSDPPGFYVSVSRDDGQTWEVMDMSLAPLSCPGNPPHERSKRAQLIVSNDFIRESGLPSCSVVWQWNHDVNLRGHGIASSQDFQQLCNGIAETRRQR